MALFLFIVWMIAILFSLVTWSLIPVVLLGIFFLVSSYIMDNV
jgi:hypothetical protein